MKIIKVFLSNGEIIELTDNDETDRTDYSIKIKDLLKSTDITILETSSSNLIIRPHKIDGILIIDDNELIGEENQDDFIRG